MDKEEIRLSVHKLLLKIHVITGWILPTNDFLDILLQQLELKIFESYLNVNSDEIEYAFRSNNSIKDWGRNMNINLIDEVLIPYLDKRFEVSKIEEQLKEPPPVQKIYTDEEILNQRRGELETAFQAMKKGNIVILHTYFSEVLIQDGLMSEEEKIEDFLVRSLATTQNLYTK